MGKDDQKASATEKAAAAAAKAAKTRKPKPVAQTAEGRKSEPEKATRGGGESAACLEVKHVWQRYPKPKGGHQIVLNDINLSVPKPEFISVVGPSGCGKSTLLRLILGSEPPWKGTVHAAGELVVHPDRNRGIVFQRYSLFPNLTVLQNVMFGLEIDGTWLLEKWLLWPWHRKTHQRYREQAMEYLETVKLAEHADKYPQQLSGGMQQRVAIAQAMIMKPAILLMDEPFGALDPGTREDLQLTIIETFEQQQTSIFFVTHDLEEAIFVGGRLLVLSTFYSDDVEGPEEGAKVVMNVPTPRSVTTGDKKKGEFQDFIEEVRLQGFDPAHRQHVDDFDHRQNGG